MKAIGRQSFLIVFDFDHTVVDCNTDEVIPRALDPILPTIQHTMKSKLNMQWTNIMDTLTSTYTKEELAAAAHQSIELDPDMPKVFEYLLEAKYRYTKEALSAATVEEKHRVPEFLEINIASDANLMFIDASLDARLPFLKNHISQIHSNPYYEVKPGAAKDSAEYSIGMDVCYGNQKVKVNHNKNDEAARDELFKSLYEAIAAKKEKEEGTTIPNKKTDFTRKSRVCWYEPHGHDCPCCLYRGKPNMCKTKIIQRIANTTKLNDFTIIFVGDGANDYCPILNLLRPRDFMFARRNFPIHDILSTPTKDGNIVGGCCQIGLWENAKELLQLFQAAIDHPTQARLPTLSRFYDVTLQGTGPAFEEFRALSLKKRCGDVLRRTSAAWEKRGGKDRLHPSATALAEAAKLIAEIESNSLVRPLPGQYQVDNWLKNFAYVAEDSSSDAPGAVTARATVLQGPHDQGGHFHAVAPRWGQLPWLHGEIYFFHLVFQLLQLRDPVEAVEQEKSGKESVEGEEETVVVNAVTPHAFHHPFYDQETLLPGVTTDGFVATPTVPHQTTANSESLFTNPLLNEQGIIVQVQKGALAGDGNVEVDRIPLHTVVAPPLNNLLPAAPNASDSEDKKGAKHFRDYFDIFYPEKLEVVSHFIKTGTLMNPLLCSPWEAVDAVGETSFAKLLLSWMLWGNGVDSSMFSIEELQRRDAEKKKEQAEQQKDSSKESSDEFHNLKAACREKEVEEMHKKYNDILGNEMDRVCHHLEEHFKKARSTTDPNFVNRIDIVQDNTGVESVTDMCFALWFLQQATPTSPNVPAPQVIFHVKPMPYYVSDVTARDFYLVLHLLEEEVKELEKLTDTQSKFVAEQTKTFVKLVKEKLTNGQFVIDADMVWTQPCEYRELSPRIINRYFYTQHIGKEAKKEDNINKDVQTSLLRCNKDAFIPKSALVFFKGDLNFRRLLGDRHWNREDNNTSNLYNKYTEQPQYKFVAGEVFQDTPENATEVQLDSFSSIMARYWPTHVVPVCAIRTMKSELAVGVSEETKHALDHKNNKFDSGADPAWRCNGNYGVILFADK